MTRRILLTLGICTFALSAQQPGKTHLKVGDAAPDFKLRATNGQTVSLSDYKGKATFVLAFFPAAFTGGCTNEMKNYHADLSKFEAMGAKVFGISTDNLPSQKYWADEVLKVQVPILSDFQKETAKAYGVLLPAGVAARTTFVIDAEGKIQHIEEGKDAIEHAGSVTACSRLRK
jgi:thioredoxin-dependent peroxiredoxin